MIVDIESPSRAAGATAGEWTTAEILDTPLLDDLTLRAVVYQSGTRKWQWSISSVDGERGEVISVGVARSAEAARQMAASEIAKCLQSPFE